MFESGLPRKSIGKCDFHDETFKKGDFPDETFVLAEKFISRMYNLSDEDRCDNARVVLFGKSRLLEALAPIQVMRYSCKYN